MSGNEEDCVSDEKLVDPLTGRSSTGDSSGTSAGGLFNCRGTPDELNAALLCGISAGIGSHDVSHVNRLTVGSQLTSFGFPLREEVCRPFDTEQIIALVNKAAGPQLDDAVPSLSSVSSDSETTRKVGDRQVLSEPLDFHPHGTGLQCKLSPPDALGASVSSFKASWQSLRKCAFAAPHFHDDDMPIPEVGEHGLPTFGNDVGADGEAGTPTPANSSLADPMGWVTYDDSTLYEIERIVSASRVGRGWQFMVKWKGYPDPTPEPLWKILRDTNHPDILAQIEQCKEDFLAANPSARALGQLPEPEVPEPTRVQPGRARVAPERLILSLFGAADSLPDALGIWNAFRSVRRATHGRYRALRQMTPEG